MDALHLIRSAAEFADTIERDAQEAAAKQVGKAEQEIRESQMELQQREAEIARIRQETERQRGEIMNAARNEAREILTKANRDSSSELESRFAFVRISRASFRAALRISPRCRSVSWRMRAISASRC